MLTEYAHGPKNVQCVCVSKNQVYYRYCIRDIKDYITRRVKISQKKLTSFMSIKKSNLPPFTDSNTRRCPIMLGNYIAFLSDSKARERVRIIEHFNNKMEHTNKNFDTDEAYLFEFYIIYNRRILFSFNMLR